MMSVKLMNANVFLAVGIIIVTGVTGCRSAQPDQTVVIPPEYAKLMKTYSENDGPHRAWADLAQIRKYDKIIVEVEISPTQLEESWWAKQNIRRLVASTESDMKYVADYTQKSFAEAFTKSRDFKLVKKPGPDTLVLEFAIVQVVPNKPVLGAISNLSSLTPIGLILLPVKLGMKGVTDNTGGAIAMESILRDSETGKILAVFADREKGRVALFNAKEFLVYGGVRAIIDHWTANLVTALDQIKAGEKINVSQPVQFTPFEF